MRFSLSPKIHPNLGAETSLTSSQAPRCASCKAHKLEIDQLKSWRVDQLSNVKLAMIKISDPWVQEWRPWEGSVDQLDIGKSDINNTEVKIVLSTVHNFKGDLKHSKWGPFWLLGPYLFFRGNVDSVCIYTALRTVIDHRSGFDDSFPFDMFSIFVGAYILCYTCQVWIFRPTVLLSITPTPWYWQWNQHCCDWSKTLSHFGLLWSIKWFLDALASLDFTLVSESVSKS